MLHNIGKYRLIVIRIYNSSALTGHLTISAPDSYLWLKSKVHGHGSNKF